MPSSYFCLYSLVMHSHEHHNYGYRVLMMKEIQFYKCGKWKSFFLDERVRVRERQSERKWLKVRESERSDWKWEKVSEMFFFEPPYFWNPDLSPEPIFGQFNLTNIFQKTGRSSQKSGKFRVEAQCHSIYHSQSIPRQHLFHYTASTYMFVVQIMPWKFFFCNIS